MCDYDKELRKFKMLQILTLDWQVLPDDPECPFGEEDRLTLKVLLKDGTSKILGIDPSEVYVYKSYFKGTKLFTWRVGHHYSELREKLEELLGGDVETLFGETISVVVWWRMLRCKEGIHYPCIP